MTGDYVAISLPTGKVKFPAGTDAALLKSKVMAQFEAELDQIIEKKILTGEVKPTPSYGFTDLLDDLIEEDGPTTSGEAFQYTLKPLKEAVKQKSVKEFQDYLNSVMATMKAEAKTTYSPAPTGSEDHPVVATLRKVFPTAMALESRCPVAETGFHSCHWLGMTYPQPLSQVIPHLNDRHNWTTTQIAEWLENTFDAKELCS